MSIKLNAQSGGSVALDAPTQTTSSADLVFKLPVAVGSANQVLKTDGSKNLSFGAGGLFSSYAIICDQKTAGTDAGTFSSGTWVTRDLNTELADPDGIVSISNNKFTLQAGTYLVIASAPAFRVNRHMIRLMNETDGTAVEYGTSKHSDNGDQTGNTSTLKARFTIAGAKEFEISHRCQSTENTNGLGVNSNQSFTVPNEKYTFVEIYKEA